MQKSFFCIGGVFLFVDGWFTEGRGLAVKGWLQNRLFVFLLSVSLFLILAGTAMLAGL